MWDHEFESAFLQRRVYCEPDFLSLARDRGGVEEVKERRSSAPPPVGPKAIFKPSRDNVSPAESIPQERHAGAATTFRGKRPSALRAECWAEASMLRKLGRSQECGMATSSML
jgi:hypothetical protein